MSNTLCRGHRSVSVLQRPGKPPGDQSVSGNLGTVKVRKEDVRMTEKDRVEMYNCFRPGDIVLARVISLGDPAAGYLLTTAENSLGVVIAKSEVGSIMVPVSWTSMQCTTSYTIEQRKVAKVIPEHLSKLS